jgi:protein SCO1
MKPKLLFSVVAVAVGLMFAMADAGVFSRPYALHGAPVDPTFAAPDFTLNDQHGQPFQLSAQRGKLVLIFFGYTHCPDECPLTLAQFKQARDQLDRFAQADQVRFVFITIDPERDTQEQIKTYLDAFDPAFVGLTGSEADLTPVWRAYGVYRQKQPGSTPDDYSMDHSAQVYLVDTRGNWRLTWPPELAAQDMVQDIRYLLWSR